MTHDPHGLVQEHVATIHHELPPHVQLIAVTKHVAPAYIRTAIAAGVTDIGENRVQEALLKYPELQDLPVTWHLIGHLQNNKAAKALQIFTWIDSVHSLELAERLDRLAGEMGKHPHILLQVKLVPEDVAKSGFTVDALWSAMPALKRLKNLAIEGLMTMAPYVSDKMVIQNVFKSLKDLKDEINQKNALNNPLRHLSMGMSQDYPIAIAQGATMIRVGSKIFAHCV